MIKNYLKIAFRNIVRFKTYSLINISGLALGMASAIIILLWVADELSFDKYHAKADCIYRLYFSVSGKQSFKSPATMGPAGPAMVAEYPQVANTARIKRYRSASVKYKDKLFQEEGLLYADNELFDIFTFPFIKGNPKFALNMSYSVVITESMAEKYFADENPIGKTLTIDGISNFTVTGVIKNIPQNSHFTFNMLVSFETLHAINYPEIDNWTNIEYYTYILLNERSDYRELENKFPNLLAKHIGERSSAMGGNIDLYLQPLKDIHLYPKFRRDMAITGDIVYVYLFSGIAIFMLIIACINFINLTTARAAIRMGEIALRKTFGADRKKLIFQFLSESVIFSIIALIVAGFLVELVLPFFNTFINRNLQLSFSINSWLIPGAIGLVIFAGLLSGGYPAFYLSAIQPNKILKGHKKSGLSSLRLRNGLIIFQSVISIILIIGSITIGKQIQFFKNKQLGFDKESVLIIPGMNENILQSYRSIQSNLRNIPGIVDVSASSIVPGRGNLIGTFYPEGFDKPQKMDYMDVDYNYFSLMNIDLLKGRYFSSTNKADKENSVIINEAAALQFGWEDPIGKRFRIGKESFLSLIGVVKDFHRTSLHRKIEPMIFFYDSRSFNYISIRILPENIPQTVSMLKTMWNEINPNRPLNFFFLNESLGRLYQSEERMGTMSLYFCLMAIFIGSMGLFGLSAFIAELRRKELGIRKVLGASSKNLFLMLSNEFTKKILIANIISWPLAWYFTNKWLQNFAYRIEVGWWVFFLSGSIAMIIAVLTISSQAIKVAKANPVESLRYE
jgi:putative ABC transport system permease protein